MDNSALDANLGYVNSMSQAFSPTFGNVEFQIDPVGTQGQAVDNNFPYIPYVSLEALLYQQMASNPLSAPYTVMGGSNTGQHVIGGQITQQDQNGTSRYMQGYQSQTG